MRRRHSIAGVLYEKTTGSAGQKEYRPITGVGPGTESAPITVACNVRPLDTEEIQFWGERGGDTRKVFADTWPFDIHSALTFNGDSWYQLEPEKDFDYGTGTKHHEVVIRKR